MELQRKQFAVCVTERDDTPKTREAIGVGTFVILKNGCFGAITGICSVPEDADDEERAMIYDYDFEMRPINEAADDEFPVRFEDILWASPAWVKTSVEIENS